VFYFSDNDHLKHPDIEVKRETPCAETMPFGILKGSSLSMEPSSSSSAMSSRAAAPIRKRLHRSAAATVKSYAYAQLDSDDEKPTCENTSESPTAESDLQLWIKHLSVLHRDETKKVSYRMIAPLSPSLCGRTLSSKTYTSTVQREETTFKAV
jgi:hypothetical protein